MLSLAYHGASTSALWSGLVLLGLWTPGLAYAILSSPNPHSFHVHMPTQTTLERSLPSIGNPIIREL